ncbi:MAG TPA: type II toxin-antitoxin system RelE/ParE family toxin [Chitinophagaceae bacterium]
MGYSILFSLDAEKEAMEAYDWYNQISDELAESFQKSLESKIESLRENPFIPSYILEDYRSCKIRRFPYNIIFKVMGTQIHITAIFHSSRNPSEWIKRI